METYNSHRHASNPEEENFYKKFLEHINNNSDDISCIVFPPDFRSGGRYPSDTLNPREENIVITTIQWLGSPVGQNFLRECGFTKT